MTYPRSTSRPTWGRFPRARGFSTERRLERQTTIGLFTDEFGFMAAHKLPDVTIMADAGMISDANKKAIEPAGLSFILGMRTPETYPFPPPYATHSR